MREGGRKRELSHVELGSSGVVYTGESGGSAGDDRMEEVEDVRWRCEEGVNDVCGDGESLAEEEDEGERSKPDY
jgi:hypothetical protein